MSTTNFIIYLREDLPPEVKQKISNWKLSDVIKQLGIKEGKITSHDDNTVTITETNNMVGAALKKTLGQWCIVETYVEVHPKLTKNLGPLARGN